MWGEGGLTYQTVFKMEGVSLTKPYFGSAGTVGRLVLLGTVFNTV